jgi:hypothetical protein
MMKAKKNTVMGGILAVLAIFWLVFTACGGSGGGGKSLNSAEALKEYLNKQPANGPDKPIKVAMKANEMMIGDIAKVIKEAGKYVSLNLSGSPLTIIPEEVFEGCETLAGITIPDSVTSIGYDAFAGTSLTSVTIPNSVTSIEEDAFSSTGLTSIKVDSGNANYASEGGILYNKAKTEIVYVPRGISGNVIIPNGVTSIEEGAFAGSGLTSVTIPNSVTYIDEAAFRGCTSLTSVTIPDSVTIIGGGAFAGTGLTSVTIPNSVTSIEGRAFGGCTSLTSVTFQGTIDGDEFGDYDYRWGILFGYVSPFDGDFHNKYRGMGTYTRPSGSDTWTKQ